jgi:hypothetical protein
MPGVAKKRIGPAQPAPDAARGDASSAVLRAAREAGEALRRAGDDGAARAVEEILSAVAGAVWCVDTEALTAKHGPQKWARAYVEQTPGRALYATRIESARAFVAEIQTGIDASLPTQRLAVEASNWLVMRGQRAGFVGEPQVNHVAAVVAKMERVALRKIPDAKAYAVAALIGWGLTSAEARDQLKNADC